MTITMGTVCVALRAAGVVALTDVMMTSGLARTSSVAASGQPVDRSIPMAKQDLEISALDIAPLA